MSDWLQRIRCFVGRHRRIRVIERVEPISFSLAAGFAGRILADHYECGYCGKRLTSLD